MKRSPLTAIELAADVALAVCLAAVALVFGDELVALITDAFTGDGDSNG